VRAVNFESPWFLVLLLVVPLMLAFALWLDHRRTKYAVAFTNLDVLASVAPKSRRPIRWVPLVLFLLALACASTAIARPTATVPVPADRATIILLVDVSGSMRASDVKPTRLGAAQAAMGLFADRVPKAVKIGLVSFSSTADELVVPTTDRTLLHEGIDLLVPEAGTAIGDGLALAVQVEKSALAGVHRNKQGWLPGAIVLLSDGAQTRGFLTPLQGAAKARDAGLRVFTVALGTPNGTLDAGGFGGFGRFPVRPDPVTLAAIAKATGGETFQAKSASKVQSVYKELGASVATKPSRREVSSWFVGLAALLLLAALGTAKLTGERLP
jgi:Ca-activated chloride channel family protein